MFLFDVSKLDIYKATDLLPLKCEYCNTIFYKSKKYLYEYFKNKTDKICCSHKCSGAYKISNKPKIQCIQCGKERIIDKADIKKNKSGNFFCSCSCAATYNNTHKTTGSRKSKLESWLETKLSVLYPDLNILYCNKQAINSELDIYIPSLNLAFEINGIYHYEPIHGPDKLNQIQNNDNRKYQACIEHNIELCIIDSSNLKYFKERNCIKYLDIIIKIINSKL